MQKRILILASQSKQRQLICQGLGLKFKSLPARINEQAIQELNLDLKAQKIALAKAHKISQRYPQAIIFAADTFCYSAGQILEKPQNIRQAKEMLNSISGQLITAYTGFAYCDQLNLINYQSSRQVKLKMRKINQTEIERYVKNKEVLTWSAAFSPAYPAGAALIENCQGSLTAFTYGLPVEELVKCLKKSKIYI